MTVVLIVYLRLTSVHRPQMVENGFKRMEQALESRSSRLVPPLATFLEPGDQNLHVMELIRRQCVTTVVAFNLDHWRTSAASAIRAEWSDAFAIFAVSSRPLRWI
jgi:hypothetical protein